MYSCIIYIYIYDMIYVHIYIYETVIGSGQWPTDMYCTTALAAGLTSVASVSRGQVYGASLREPLGSRALTEDLTSVISLGILEDLTSVISLGIPFYLYNNNNIAIRNQ